MSVVRPSLAQVADQELVRRALHGDKTAFATVFERHRPTAVALARRLLEREDVEDVLQASAVQAMVCLDRLQDPARFGPWLCGVALNLGRQQLRREGRQARPPLGGFGPPLTEELVEGSDMASRVRHAIATPPWPTRSGGAVLPRRPERAGSCCRSRHRPQCRQEPPAQAPAQAEHPVTN